MSENSIKRLCCTCLSTDRKLFFLYRVTDGINLLYMLLTQDPEAYKNGFYRDTASLLVCWECCAIMLRIKKFQTQACAAQKSLSSIADGRKDLKLQSFSRLTTTINATPHYEFQSNDITENFIDCGLGKVIKTEGDSDDVPLSVLYFENVIDNFEPGNSDYEPVIYKVEINNDKVELDNNKVESGNDKIESGSNKIESGNNIIESGNDKIKSGNNKNESGNNIIESDKYNIIRKRKSDKSSNFACKSMTKVISKKYNKYFSIMTMNDEEMLKSVEKRKTDIKESVLKCDTCIIGFKTELEFIDHNTNLHTKKDNFCKCDICDIYTEDLPTHRQTHYQYYNCILCTHTAYTHIEIVEHLKINHRDICWKKRMSKLQNDVLSGDIPKYPCSECDMCFQNKDLRWNHVQRAHKEWYKCNMCDKKFAFRNNLERHLKLHEGPLPREECPTCHKMIRIDLVKAHSRIHTNRETFFCVECDKSFVSRETYESHLKYTQVHATIEICRHKCPSCDKRYRSRGELRDHINYQHKGQAEHKCPICGKGLATKRCIRRHVRRAHEGIKESPKDKICQQCGRAFRNKKGLVEHERTHSGARPLSCDICGRTFRQNAALYTHKRRLHPPANASTSQ